MRIGLVIYGRLDTTSGGYLYDRKLVAMLQQRGHTVKLISLPWRTYLAHLQDNSSDAFFNTLRTLDVDVLLQDELNHPSLAWLNTRLKRARPDLPLLSIVHHLRCSENHPQYARRNYRNIERRYLNSVDGFICNSYTTQAVVKDLLRTPKPMIVATPGGDRFQLQPAVDAVRARAFAAGPLRLLFLGSVTPRKQLLTVLGALNHLPAGIATLTVVGPADVNLRHANACRKFAAGLPSNVTFMGKLDTENVKSQLLNSQVLVLPSNYEGFGIVYLESLAAGLPVIASTSGAASEVIGNAGYTVPPGNATQIAAHIMAYHTDRELLATHAQLALQRFTQFPTWAQSMANACEFIEGFSA